MFAKLNKLDVENLTKSLSQDSQEDIEVICWGWVGIFQKGQSYTCSGREREAVVMQLIHCTVGKHSA